jgi:hypothetical protein
MSSNPRILGLPEPLRRQFKRALQLAGSNQSKWLFVQVRQLIRAQKERYGEDLFQVLTEEERDLLAVIISGAAEVQHIAEESLLPVARVEVLLKDLVNRGIIEKAKKGGKTDQARGARIDLYFVSPKYKSGSE